MFSRRLRNLSLRVEYSRSLTIYDFRVKKLYLINMFSLFTTFCKTFYLTNIRANKLYLLTQRKSMINTETRIYIIVSILFKTLKQTVKIATLTIRYEVLLIIDFTSLLCLVILNCNSFYR